MLGEEIKKDLISALKEKRRNSRFHFKDAHVFNVQQGDGEKGEDTWKASRILQKSN